MQNRVRRQTPRRDIVATTNSSLSEALMKASAAVNIFVPPAKREQRCEAAQKSLKDIRLDYIEPVESDPTGYERIIGESDLTSINYLDRGRRAAAAVCRIQVPSDSGGWCGTGFLIAPRLLMTNHHVLGSRDEAGQAEAEFGYEHDLDGVLLEPVSFNLQPHEVFYADAELDVAIVAVAPKSSTGTPIERYGWLPLIPLRGKTADREWVTIIQHPQGGPKQIAIRSNQIIHLPKSAVKGVNLDHFIHYLTDTEPGSSGAPVLNDQWQVVALHHKAVPAPVSKKTPDGEDEFIGNEGVRISAIYDKLEQQRFENANAAAALERMETALGLAPPAPDAEDTSATTEATFKADRWKKKGIGYNPDFIKSAPISLADVYAPLADDAAPLLHGSGHELKYNRFSVVIHEKRKFAMLTAVNIGDKLTNLPASGSWRHDNRIDRKYQPGDNFYVKDPAKDKVAFSRGHMVRRLDPCWGTAAEAKLAEQDTFHFTNAAPQVQHYNDVEWGNLEDYVLAKALVTEKRMSVFTGPIFRSNDHWYGRKREDGPWQIPISFWKIAVLQKTKDQVVAAAFIVGQLKYVRKLYEAKVFTGLNPYTPEKLRKAKIQVTIKTVEEETGLDFSAIRKFDAHGSLESTRQARWLNTLDDILI